jgi:hypothetical protein
MSIYPTDKLGLVCEVVGIEWWGLGGASAPIGPMGPKSKLKAPRAFFGAVQGAHFFLSYEGVPFHSKWFIPGSDQDSSHDSFCHPACSVQVCVQISSQISSSALKIFWHGDG